MTDPSSMHVLQYFCLFYTHVFMRLGTVHYFYWRGAGSYKQNTSQKHMTPPLCRNEKSDDPPFGIYKKVMTPSPAYATIMIIPNNSTKYNIIKI